MFQVCALSDDGTIAWNRKVSRAKLSGVLEELPKSALIAMEACSSSNLWGRYLLERGFRVAVIPAQHVKPFATNALQPDCTTTLLCAVSNTSNKPELTSGVAPPLPMLRLPGQIGRPFSIGVSHHSGQRSSNGAKNFGPVWTSAKRRTSLSPRLLLAFSP